MVLAMPSDGLWGDGSGYLPHHEKNFERWIVDDVPNAVRAALPTERVEYFPKQTFLAGLSMGGFGALRLAAKFPEQFSAVYGLSSITHLNQLPLFVEEPLSQYAQDDPVEESVLEVMIRNRSKLLPIQFDCGTDDVLIEPNRALHQGLLNHQIPHTYTEYPGGHEWPYWQEHLSDALLFFNSAI
ncbi:alpha/beta hydrolase [Spirosoma telluris]|uniref:alpha/beta hydrolase n=1 Tax=Spirosoma telluris TaxID=2183553 RepID=UPI002FC28788